MTDFRSEQRLLDSELVMLCWQENQTTFKQLGNVENVSLDGVGLVVDDPLCLGTEVTITYGEGELFGVVRHHSRLVDGHFLGIEFSVGSKNSTLHFQPELLLGLA